jgi:hypothetical protein
MRTPVPSAPFKYDFLEALTERRLKLREFLPSVVAQIRQSVLVPQSITDDALAQAFLLALDDYYLWHCKYGAFADGVGTTKSMVRLAKAIKTSISILNMPGVLNRIHIARQTLDGTDAPIVPTDLDYEYNPLKNPALIVGKLQELLDIVEHAQKDGRRLVKADNGGLRAAAKPLYELWVNSSGKASGTWKGPGSSFSPAVLFLTACLKQIDSRANKRMVADFQLKAGTR